MYKKTLIVICILVCILLASSNLVLAKEYTIGIAAYSTSGDTTSIYFNYTKFLIEQRGSKVVGTNANDSPDRLIQNIETLIQMKCDAIIITPADAASYAKPVEKAVAKGIAVIGLDTGIVPGMLFTNFANNFVMGADTAMYLAEYIGGEGKIAKFFSFINLPLRQRSKAFDAVMTEYPNIEVIAHNIDLTNFVGDTYNTVRDTILAHPDLKGVWVAWDTPAMGAVRAVRESGKKIAIAGIDGNQITRKELKDPTSPYVVTSYEDAKALTKWSVEKLFEYLETGKLPKVKVTFIYPPLWDKDTVPEPFNELKW